MLWFALDNPATSIALKNAIFAAKFKALIYFTPFVSAVYLIMVIAFVEFSFYNKTGKTTGIKNALNKKEKMEIGGKNAHSLDFKDLNVSRD